MKFILYREDVVQILNLIDKLNPLQQDYTDSDSIELEVDNSSGIGNIIKAHVPLNHQGIKGRFTIVISDEESW